MNKLRHQLLGILAQEYASGQNQPGSILDIILLVPSILKKLNITHDEFVIMSTELLDKKEIKYLEINNDMETLGLYALSDGITAYANEKYLKIAREQRREDIKFWAQLILPVLSFIIAAMALYLNIKTQNDVDTVKDEKKLEKVITK